MNGELGFAADAKVDEVLMDALGRDNPAAVRKAVRLVAELRPDWRLPTIWNRVRQLKKKLRRTTGPQPTWTPELDEILIEGYARGAAGARAAIDRVLKLRPLWPRHWAWKRAAKLGVARKRSEKATPWSEEEVRRLVFQIGSVPTARLAAELGRSEAAVRSKVAALGYDSRYQEGYSQRELAQRLRVSRNTVRRWLEKKWLTRRSGRITKTSLRAFCQQHREKIRFDTLDHDTREWLVDELGYQS